MRGTPTDAVWHVRPLIATPSDYTMTGWIRVDEDLYPTLWEYAIGWADEDWIVCPVTSEGTEVYGGRIWVTSGPETGASVHFSLPVANERRRRDV